MIQVGVRSHIPRDLGNTIGQINLVRTKHHVCACLNKTKSTLEIFDALDIHLTLWQMNQDLINRPSFPSVDHSETVLKNNYVAFVNHESMSFPM